jgi:2-amino-4-hydroxy-6-hydroxymethyldihydropteridine diphosphokinase
VHLDYAVDALSRARGAVFVARSRTYETAPWGDVPQGPYLNAAVALEWDASPEALLELLLRVERDRGRVRDVRYGPRTLDLDLLWVDGVIVERDDLSVPHQCLHERAFALLPLLDVAPRARDPRTGEPYRAPPPEGILRIL